MKNERFYGYNRHDNFYPRTCREAFGTAFKDTSYYQPSKRSVVVLKILGFSILLGGLLWLSSLVQS